MSHSGAHRYAKAVTSVTCRWILVQNAITNRLRRSMASVSFHYFPSCKSCWWLTLLMALAICPSSCHDQMVNRLYAGGMRLESTNISECGKYTPNGHVELIIWSSGIDLHSRGSQLLFVISDSIRQFISTVVPVSSLYYLEKLTKTDGTTVISPTWAA